MVDKKEYLKNWYQKNKDKKKQYFLKYYLINKDKIKQKYYLKRYKLNMVNEINIEKTKLLVSFN